MPILFAIGIEPLATAIRNAEGIKGIKIGQMHSKISLFADDILVTLTEPRDSLQELNSILNQFGMISGLTINHTKTFLYPVNLSEAQHREIKDFPL